MKPRILIAGVGNLFHGDDAFGCEVARRLAAEPLPPQVRLVDFGIRGLDLAFALQENYLAVILLDIAHRGGQPGTLYVIEVDEHASDPSAGAETLDSHGMHPLRVFRLIQAWGELLPPIYLVACEPETLGPDEGQMGLSRPVAAAVPEAIALVQSLVQRMCS